MGEFLQKTMAVDVVTAVEKQLTSGSSSNKNYRSTHGGSASNAGVAGGSSSKKDAKSSQRKSRMSHTNCAGEPGADIADITQRTTRGGRVDKENVPEKSSALRKLLKDLKEAVLFDIVVRAHVNKPRVLAASLITLTFKYFKSTF
jgi:hypothetical protein